MRNLFGNEISIISGGLIKDPNNYDKNPYDESKQNNPIDRAALEVGATGDGSNCSYAGTDCSSTYVQRVGDCAREFAFDASAPEALWCLISSIFTEPKR